MASGGGAGTYTVTGLVSWEFANFQAPTPAFIDNIDDGTRANGTAVLSIAFSDGRAGVLTVGCHGPGAPPGIFEGIATTKGYKTYYAVQPPVPGVDANRTNFHVRYHSRRAGWEGGAPRSPPSGPTTTCWCSPLRHSPSRCPRARRP